MGGRNSCAAVSKVDTQYENPDGVTADKAGRWGLVTVAIPTHAHTNVKCMYSMQTVYNVCSPLTLHERFPKHLLVSCIGNLAHEKLDPMAHPFPLSPHIERTIITLQLIRQCKLSEFSIVSMSWS